jgi:hypothetical protein
MEDMARMSFARASSLTKTHLVLKYISSVSEVHFVSFLRGKKWQNGGKSSKSKIILQTWTIKKGHIPEGRGLGHK